MHLHVTPPLLYANTDTQQLFVWIIFALYIIWIPISIYYGYKYYQHRHFVCIAKRRYKLTIICILACISFFINKMFYCLNAIYYNSIILRIIFLSTYAFTTHTILWFCALKYWLLLYDIKFSILNAGNQWKICIDPSFNINTNWFIFSKKTYGNESYCKKRILFILFVTISSETILSFIKEWEKYVGFFDIFCLLIPLILIGIFWNKTDKYLDYFRIREESRMLVIGAGILIGIYSILMIIETFLGKQIDIFVIVITCEYIFGIGVFIICLFWTFWTLNKNQHLLQKDNPSKLYLNYRALNKQVTKLGQFGAFQIQKSLSIDSDDGMEIMQSDIETHVTINNKSIANFNKWDGPIGELVKVIENEHAFEVFIAHLLTEFALESILAICEFTQYQMLIISLSQISYKHIIKLSSIVPKSGIIKDCDDNIKLIATKLIEKYIPNGCEFELNISYRLKYKLLSDIKNIQFIDEISLIHIFDDCIQSLLFLLYDSWLRFIQTPQYKAVQKEVQQNVDSNNYLQAVSSVN
eukprot:335144_1